ncbi:MAG: Gfo/Idh/MocA family protein [Armatimonadota bacterium]
MQRVAVVGAGRMGEVHSAAYARMPEAELVAICDIVPEAAQKLAAAHKVPAFDQFEQMISQVELDVVDICVPTFAHLDCIKAAANVGKHIMCEKPLARTVSQAQEAVLACEEAGVALFVAHVLRWFPEYRKLRNLLADGSIGETVEVRTSRGGAHPHAPDDWYADYKRSGGVVLDLMIHDFDWLRWCFGKAHRVYARGLVDAKVPGTDYALVTIRFDSGVVAHVEGTWARPSGFVTSVEIAGTKGLLNYSSSDSAPLVIERKVSECEAVGVTVPENSAFENPYFLELRHFIHCLDSGQTPEVTHEDGVEAVRIAEAALRSISSGQPVVLT